jgi:ABC-type transporter Mla maintaining outer membrane lipid asymmetry permease subunit MlaE
MKKAILLLLVILIFALFTGGLAFAWDIIKTFAYAFYSFLVAIIPFLDLEQAILCKVVTIFIVQVLCCSGYYMSHKAESTIGKIVSGIADVIATMLLLIA